MHGEGKRGGQPVQLYDTSLLVDFLHGKDAAVEHVENTKGVTTVINAFELLRGAHHTGRPEPAKQLLERLDVLPIAPEHAAELGAAQLRDGDYPGDADVLIAGTAKRHGVEAIATRDKHFARFDIKIANY